mgnify:CR=1 FL=1
MVSRDSRKVVDALLQSPQAVVYVNELVNHFNSGATLMNAVTTLSRQGLVDYVDPEIRLTDKGKNVFGHHSYGAEGVTLQMPPDPSLFCRLKKYPKSLFTFGMALLGFFWFLFSQVLSPSWICPKLPNYAQDALARCGQLQAGENK